jgi:hypothetical protein
MPARDCSRVATTIALYAFGVANIVAWTFSGA